MRIEHLAIWARDIELLKSFYCRYFSAEASEKYYNPTKYFTSYFLSFDNGCRLELMHIPEITVPGSEHNLQRTGLAHFAISTGSRQAVDNLTDQLRGDGYKIIGEPRLTGDRYYESVALDPEDNRIEITI